MRARIQTATKEGLSKLLSGCSYCRSIEYRKVETSPGARKYRALLTDASACRLLKVKSGKSCIDSTACRDDMYGNLSNQRRTMTDFLQSSRTFRAGPNAYCKKKRGHQQEDREKVKRLSNFRQALTPRLTLSMNTSNSSRAWKLPCSFLHSASR